MFNRLMFGNKEKIFLHFPNDFFCGIPGEPSGKNRKFDFKECPVIDDCNVLKSLVQITVDEDEVQRRIRAFIDMKRSEANENVRDFIDSNIEDSCARVNSCVYRIKDSKGHLRVRKVKNESGPAVTASPAPATAQPASFDSIDERLRGAESFLKLDSAAIPKDVYQRLKMIEDHIADLRAISPEYSQFLAAKGGSAGSAVKKTVYSLEDLDRIILKMETGD